MDKYKFSPKILIGILLVIFFGVSLILRIVPPYDQIFSGDWTKFSSIDAYYYMRLVDNLAHNFPTITAFDPFFIYPGGGSISGVHFFDWLLAGIIWVIGLGSPTPHTIDVIGVYFPAVLAALTVIPVYFIGRALFNRWAGVLAAALIAILSGEYIGRSILGFTDHHVAETLFSTVTVLFLILAIKEAEQTQLNFGHLMKRDRTTVVRPLIYSLLAGIFLGVYLITWQGSLLFVFIIALYLIVQFIINHLRQKSSDHLGIIGFILFLVALIIFLPFSTASFASASLVIAVFIPLVLSGVSLLISGKGLKRVYYPLTLIGIGVVFMAIFYAFSSNTLGVILSQFKIFAPVGATATTTMEMQPFLSPQGSFTLDVAWGNFNTSFFFSLIALIVILIHIIIKRGTASNGLLLFFIWSLVIMVATLGQRRFAYYFAANVALLTGYFSVLAYYLVRFIIDNLRRRNTDYMSWEILGLAGFTQLIAQPASPQTGWERKKPKQKKRQEASFRPTTTQVSIGIWLILAVFLLAFFPNVGLLGTVLGLGKDSDISFGEAWWRSCLVGSAQNTAAPASFAPPDAWQASLLWMKDNTPDPFGDPDAYYELYEVPPSDKEFQYPESAYGVTSWWDYGYWITRTAHRLPSANPSQASEPITKVAKLFLSQEESLSYEVMEELDSSYLIIDYETCTSKFWAIVHWSEQEQDKYIGVYYVPREDMLVPTRLFHPEYYQSMCVRLYNFDAKTVTAEKPVVITYDEKVSSDGKPYKQITNAEKFDSYQEALEHIESQGSANHRIVGTNQFISPVPLEALKNYKLAYSSESGKSHPDAGLIPEVKIFEYTLQE